MYADIKIGNNFYIQVVQLPKGYELSDLVCSSSDERVVKVNNDGVVTAQDIIGSAVITVKTKDNKYSSYIAITVTDVYDENFEPLNNGSNTNYGYYKELYV